MHTPHRSGGCSARNSDVPAHSPPGSCKRIPESTTPLRGIMNGRHPIRFHERRKTTVRKRTARTHQRTASSGSEPFPAPAWRAPAGTGHRNKDAHTKKKKTSISQWAWGKGTARRGKQEQQEEKRKKPRPFAPRSCPGCDRHARGDSQTPSNQSRSDPGSSSRPPGSTTARHCPAPLPGAPG